MPFGFVVAVAAPLLANKDWQWERRRWSLGGAGVIRRRGRVVAVPAPLVGQYGLAAGVKEEEVDSSSSSEALWLSCCSCFPAVFQTKWQRGRIWQRG